MPNFRNFSAVSKDQIQLLRFIAVMVSDKIEIRFFPVLDNTTMNIPHLFIQFIGNRNIGYDTNNLLNGAIRENPSFAIWLTRSGLRPHLIRHSL